MADKKEWHVGDPVGPDVDGSFHAPDFFDPKTGKRIATDWDSPGQGDGVVADGVDEKGKMVVGLTDADLKAHNTPKK